MAAQHAAHRPCNKTHGESAECRDRARQRIAADGKEQFAEYERGCRSIKKEVVPLEYLAEHGRRHRAADAACLAYGRGRRKRGCRVRIHGIGLSKTLKFPLPDPGTGKATWRIRQTWANDRSVQKDRQIQAK